MEDRRDQVFINGVMVKKDGAKKFLVDKSAPVMHEFRDKKEGSYWDRRGGRCAIDTTIDTTTTTIDIRRLLCHEESRR